MKAARASNRTGIARSPRLSAEMVAGTKKFPPSSRGDRRGLSRMRVRYSNEAEPLGTVPPPAGPKGTVKLAVRALMGAKLMAMLDKLGERLAFERTGVRLYEALVSKHEAFGGFAGGPELSELTHIRNEELEHFELLREVITRLGGDPTAVTPSADVQGTASKGIEAVVTDPRMNLLQSLEVILIAELADNACWEALIEMARGADDTLADAFEKALENEREHLENVRAWIAAGQGRRSGSRERPKIAGRAERRGSKSRNAPKTRKRRTASTRPRSKRRATKRRSR